MWEKEKKKPHPLPSLLNIKCFWETLVYENMSEIMEEDLPVSKGSEDKLC